MKRIREFESVEEKVAPFIKTIQQKEGINTYISAIIKKP